MDTRSKILTLAAALELRPAVTIVSGTFDVLRAGHARELAAIRNRSQTPLLVVVLPAEKEVMPQEARAKMVAALRMVDYVVIADAAELNRLIDVLRPAEVARLEAADAHRLNRLIEHVHRRQSR
jgi:bifunctional ADP-heptose synthase (sugar kinase/adenylyltransferase)